MLPSLKLTPLKLGHPKRKGSSSNHPFSGAMLVSGRVVRICLPQDLQAQSCLEGGASRSLRFYHPKRRRGSSSNRHVFTWPLKCVRGFWLSKPQKLIRTKKSPRFIRFLIYQQVWIHSFPASSIKGCCLNPIRDGV